jgi:UDP-3-O-[3-hydroxymyristoyl] glucosamine N-acyltransferase
VTWDGVFRLAADPLDRLAQRHGGFVWTGARQAPRALASVDTAGLGDLAPVFSRRFLSAAREAAGRGADFLVAEPLVRAMPWAHGVWGHPHPVWALASILDDVKVPDAPPVVGQGSRIDPRAVLGPRVVLGERVVVGAGAVIGHPGFGWADGPNGAIRAVPQLAGVVIEDDVSIGPLCTVDAGTLQPTRLRRGVKLDAHVHVGHNTDIGERTLVAAQCGFAGSVRIGRGVLVGGQVGISDHVVVGDGARIAAKSGVIGDVPPGITVAGYPAVRRVRWLRALAKLYGRHELG